MGEVRSPKSKVQFSRRSPTGYYGEGGSPKSDLSAIARATAEVEGRKSKVPLSSSTFQVQCRGFTLVELLVVLFVAGLIAAFVVPSFVGGLKGMRLKGEVKHLAATLRFARSQAVCSKGLAVVKLDLDNGTYELMVKKKRRQRQSGLEGDLGLFGGGGLDSSSLGTSDSLSQSSGFGGASAFGGSSAFDTPSGELEPKGEKSDSPLAQAAKKKRKLKEGVSIAGFTYEDETYDDGICNVFFFPRGTSTGGLIEIMSESGRSFVIEIEPVTGSVKIKSKDDYL